MSDATQRTLWYCPTCGAVCDGSPHACDTSSLYVYHLETMLAAERERTADALARLDATNARLQAAQEWAKRWSNAARALHLFIRSSRNARDVKLGMVAQHRWRLTVLARKRQEAKPKRKRRKESPR